MHIEPTTPSLCFVIFCFEHEICGVLISFYCYLNSLDMLLLLVVDCFSLSSNYNYVSRFLKIMYMYVVQF